MMIAHEQHPAAGGDLTGDDRFQRADVGHSRLVDHQE
jgi:hypothetical protein